MAVDLDVSKLEQELQGIYNERQVVNERIRSYVPGRGRARGPGGPTVGPSGAPVAPFRGGPLPGRGFPGRGPAAGPYVAPRGPQGQHDFRGRDAPPAFDSRSDRPPRQNSFVSRDGREQPQPSVRDRLGPRLSSTISQEFQRQQPAAETPALHAEAAEPSGSRKRLSSAVVVGGQVLQPTQQEEDLVASKRPRPDDSEDNPAAKKRNRRMFGFLNQTLQKCKDESTDFRKSKVAQQRDEAIKRGEQRRREELNKFKADFKREMATKRQSEVNKKRELNMQADVKRAEIAFVQRLLHRSKLANFIQTTAGPPLYWLPGKPSPASQALLEKEQAKLDEFKQDEAAKVETKKQQVADSVASMAAALEAADARRREAALAPPRPAAAPAATAAADNAEGGDADAAAPMQTDAAEEAQDQDQDAEDELEDGAYVVLDEEDDDGAQAATEVPARVNNGTAADPMSTEDDRYVATAYSADEEDPRDSEPQPRPAEATEPALEPAETVTSTAAPLESPAGPSPVDSAARQGPEMLQEAAEKVIDAAADTEPMQN